MPTSHSKRNTTLAFFTSYERSLLKTAWGTQKARLSRDSFLPFGSCQLCLLVARSPVACIDGDVFCRECALSNLLAQKKEISRLEKEWERRKEEGKEREVVKEAEEHERAVRDFERVQMGLEKRGTKRAVEEEESTKGSRKVKGRFELDEDELLKTAKEERQKTRHDLDAEKKDAAKHNPSFWIPSALPDTDSAQTQETPPKLSPICPCSSEKSPHAFSLKTLTTINFTTEPNPSSKDNTTSCPACHKALSNASRGVMAIPCGHVLCKACADKFMKPAGKADPHDPESRDHELRCYICDADLTAKSKKSKKEKTGVKPGLVELKSDGTGFAGGGKAEVERKGVAFQC